MNTENGGTIYTGACPARPGAPGSVFLNIGNISAGLFSLNMRPEEAREAAKALIHAAAMAEASDSALRMEKP